MIGKLEITRNYQKLPGTTRNYKIMSRIKTQRFYFRIVFYSPSIRVFYFFISWAREDHDGTGRNIGVLTIGCKTSPRPVRFT